MLKILYIQPSGLWGIMKQGEFGYHIPRISNYLNFRKAELNENIQESYLDFRFEKVPKYIPQNLDSYHKSLEAILKNVYRSFEFNVAAISCYCSTSYLDSLEISFIIRKLYPKTLVIIGGHHPTAYPQDFYLNNFPTHYFEHYKKKNPIHYLIQDEGELSFFEIIREISQNTNHFDRQKPIIIPSNIIRDLDDFPVIDFSLFKKYQDRVAYKLAIEFSRGCYFKCNFCLNSVDHLPSYRTVRIKSPKCCIDDLRAILKTKWLKYGYLMIADPVFLPRISVRKKFFDKFDEFIATEGNLSTKVTVEERLEFCTTEMLKYYKKYNFEPHLGIESFSRKGLKVLGKVLGNNDHQVEIGIERYLANVKRVIRESSELRVNTYYNFLYGFPGESKEIIEDNHKFLLGKGMDGTSIAEKFPLNLTINKYIATPSNWFYQCSEKALGAFFYGRGWWKRFNEDQELHAIYLDPSPDFTIQNSLKENYKFLKEVEELQKENFGGEYNHTVGINALRKCYEHFCQLRPLQNLFNKKR